MEKKFISKNKTYKKFLFFYIIFSIFTLIWQEPTYQSIAIMKTLKLHDIDFNKKYTKEPTFPIDIVYTWVNGRDPKWLYEFKKAKEEKHIHFYKGDYINRYVDIEELRYSLRSVELNAPWVNMIFIVTCDQFPYWINKSHPKIKFISHSEIFPKNVKNLTFNSNSIEFLLYKIPGLSEHFIYVNDDMYFSKPVKPSDFFTKDGKNIVISNTVTWSNIDFYNKEWNRNLRYQRHEDHLFNAFTSHTIITFRNKYKKLFPYEYSHIPFPLTKSICEGANLNFEKEIEKTIENRFRESDDLHMQTLMIQYGFYTNQSTKANKDPQKAQFVVSEAKDNRFLLLSKLTYNPPKLLSINVDEHVNRDAIQGFLEFMFENISSFELSEKPPNVRPEYKKPWIKYYEKHLRRKK